MGWEYMWIFLIVSAALCAVGFKKYVYFLSIGYGFSVAGLGVAYLVTALTQHWSVSWVVAVQCLLFVAYGARLSGFLLYREIKNASYRKVLQEASGEKDKPMPFFVKCSIWVVVSVLYIMQTSPVFFRVYNGEGAELALPLAGAVLSAVGLILEALSDKQKSAQKAKRPDMVATEGLFKMVRCPNYFGEILFWTGVFVGGVSGLAGAGQWIVAVIGYIAIVYIMINGAQRLDRRQEKSNGSKPEYRAYADHTPLIIPLIPISHIGKYKE
ncbi:MAG: DUF1295 domain-containing protein [bacterium]|nr:DUF1295 domain-containing protein [bacterium]